jgi:pyruvate dehydrogenase (quinone)
MNGLITISKYWKDWSDPRLIVLVLNNEDLNQVTWEMRAQSGEPKFNASQQIPNVAYSRYAELLGLKGVYCDNPDKLGESWDSALEADRPCVLEVKTDPNIPPLPPHISLKNAKAFAATLLKGDPDEASLITKSIRQLAEEFMPH